VKVQAVGTAAKTEIYLLTYFIALKLSVLLVFRSATALRCHEWSERL